MENIVRDLHIAWTDALLSTQIYSPEDLTKHGALYCQTCGIIHGRCQEIMSALLERARQTNGASYISAAERVFAWADLNLSQADGSFRNDTDSNWLGTTVFNVIQVLDALSTYADLISPETHAYWQSRILVAAQFLLDFETIENTVINYAIGNAYAMWRSWQYFLDERFHDRYVELRTYVVRFVTISDLIFGEGANKERISTKGCKAIDIGYNLEESLPLLTRLAIESSDEELIALCNRLTLSHSEWVLSDGIVDNSFGTRNYKWTIWGSRTTDGLHLPFLVFAKPNDELAAKAMANLKLLEACTHDGFLYGGLHNHAVGEGPCLHHAITHTKALVILLQPPYLSTLKQVSNGDIYQHVKANGSKDSRVRYYPELDTYRIHHYPYTSTLTAYDWHYVYGGHITGGSLSLFHHEIYGLITASSMSFYHRQEFNNMQEPTCADHDNLSPRFICTMFDPNKNADIEYSSANDHEAVIKQIDDKTFHVKGNLKDLDGQVPSCTSTDSVYEFHYSFDDEGIYFSASCPAGHFILNLIAAPNSDIAEDTENIVIQGEKAQVTLALDQGFFDTSQHRRIFNYVPGLAAYEVHITPREGIISFALSANSIEYTDEG